MMDQMMEMIQLVMEQVIQPVMDSMVMMAGDGSTGSDDGTGDINR